jgi:hypothetical protein
MNLDFEGNMLVAAAAAVPSCMPAAVNKARRAAEMSLVG